MALIFLLFLLKMSFLVWKERTLRPRLDPLLSEPFNPSTPTLLVFSPRQSDDVLAELSSLTPRKNHRDRQHGRSSSSPLRTLQHASSPKMASQQISVADLDFKQLSEVKKQLDEVRPSTPSLICPSLV